MSEVSNLLEKTSLAINSENMTWDDLIRDVVIQSRIEVLDSIEVSNLETSLALTGGKVSSCEPVCMGSGGRD